MCVSVSIFDDTRVEDDEYFTMFFANRDGVAVSTNANSVRITISDDDGNQIDKVVRDNYSFTVMHRAVLWHTNHPKIKLLRMFVSLYLSLATDATFITMIISLTSCSGRDCHGVCGSVSG